MKIRFVVIMPIFVLKLYTSTKKEIMIKKIMLHRQLLLI